MVTQVQLTCRTASARDRQKLANLIHFETLVHRHLDWRAPLDWIGQRPYLLAERGSRLVAALSAPPDPPGIAWIRLFAVSGEVDPAEAWWSLWPAARQQLVEQDEAHVAAIPLQEWFRKLLHESGYTFTHQVIMLMWERGNLPDERPAPVSIRPMNLDDIESVVKVDSAAFGVVWRNSRTSLELAFRQSAVATVAEADGHIVAYQISTANHMGGHLARLATHPSYQKRGIGYALLRDMLVQFEKRGARHITVNTQHDNQGSISLYEKAGFHRTGEVYPVYQHSLLSETPPAPTPASPCRSSPIR